MKRIRPWKMKEGFLIGGGLLVAGLLFQMAFGSIDWRLFAAPVNYIALAVLLAVICTMFLLRRKVYVFAWMMHYTAAVPCLCYAAGLTIVMGLTAQTRHGGIPWLSQMLQFWPFVLIWTWMMVISGLATLNHLLRWKWREIPFIVNHLGVFVAVVAATLGSADRQTLQMTAFKGTPEWRAGLSVELHQFYVDYYETGMPRRFASDISVCSKDGECVSGTVEVNRPLRVNGWNIYQYDYDAYRGPDSEYSVFLLVRDPWLPAVYAGIFLMLAGALSLIFLRHAPKRKWVLLAALLLTGFFTFLTVTRMGPSAKTLPPALQSPWFIPHLIVYMAGYALLATATLLAICQLFKKRPAKPGLTDATGPGMILIDNLVYVGLAFLTIGMLFGALWAKEAWGNYWSWDPKETWAAITWLCYLLYIHFRNGRPQEMRKACWILILAFVCLQVCWWGINYLPSAQGLSIHTYTE